MSKLRLEELMGIAAAEEENKRHDGAEDSMLQGRGGDAGVLGGEEQSPHTSLKLCRRWGSFLGTVWSLWESEAR